MCRDLVELLRRQEGNEFQDAAQALHDYEGGRVILGTSEHPLLRSDVGKVYGRVLRDVRQVDGEYRTVTTDLLLNLEQSSGEFLITAVHETLHLDIRGMLSNSEILPHELRALQQLEPRFQRTAGHYLARHGFTPPPR